MKKILIITLAVLCLTGCEKEEKVNTNSELAKAKETMMSNLSNYGYEVTMITKTGFMDVTTTMDCKEDLDNDVSYCVTNTVGVEMEEYIDYNKKKSYSKTSTLFGSGEGWTTSDYKGEQTNSWLALNDYIFNIEGEPADGGTYYKGTISSEKLAQNMSEMDSSVDADNVVTDDIDITVFVNSSNYIESLSYTMEIMGIESVVEIKYKDFNTAGSITIPSGLN